MAYKGRIDFYLILFWRDKSSGRLGDGTTKDQSCLSLIGICKADDRNNQSFLTWLDRQIISRKQDCLVLRIEDARSRKNPCWRIFDKTVWILSERLETVLTSLRVCAGLSLGELKQRLESFWRF